MNTTPIHIVATARVVDWAGDQPNWHAFLTTCISRHHRRDWGDLDHHDWELNDRAVACRSGRLLSAYVVPPELDPVDAQLWIITDDIEGPDTITTLLWPTDY